MSQRYRDAWRAARNLNAILAGDKDGLRFAVYAHHRRHMETVWKLVKAKPVKRAREAA